jgi:hypothetical protein
VSLIPLPWKIGAVAVLLLVLAGAYLGWAHHQREIVAKALTRHARRPFPRRHPAARALHPGRGPIMRGFMVHTIARQLGVPFEQADEMAVAAAKAGLVRHEVDTVTLTGEGQARGATLKDLNLRPPVPQTEISTRDMIVSPTA